VAPEPSPHVLMLMRSIIVHDDMQRDIAGERLVEGAQELEEFLMPMSLLAVTDHLTLQGLQRGEERRCAIALVVMRHGPATAFLERQARLCPI